MPKLSPVERTKRARRLREMCREVWVKPTFGDGCSYSPDCLVVTVPGSGRTGTPKEVRAVSITDCCTDHDFQYATAMLDGKDATRREIDRRFRQCLRCRVGRWWASVYYYAVRAFGSASFGA